MKVHTTLVVMILISVRIGYCAKPCVQYTGTTTWDDSKGIFAFTSSGVMPGTKEEFYWSIPESVSKVVINKHVTVTGGFRVGYRNPSNPLYIFGRDRQTSVVFGTNEKQWTTQNKIPENHKWKYGAISVTADAIVYVSSLTSMNPRSYHISGYANRSVIHVDDCNLLDVRGGDNNNSDGFVGSKGSSIRNSKISTLDDAIKIYHDIRIENVMIEQHRNGAAIQFGWGGESDNAEASIRNLIIEGVNPDGLYNMAPFTWEGGISGSRTVEVTGLKVRFRGKVYNEPSSTWEPAGLFELKPNDCTFNFRATAADLGGLKIGWNYTKGSVQLQDTKNTEPANTKRSEGRP